MKLNRLILSTSVLVSCFSLASCVGKKDNRVQLVYGSIETSIKEIDYSRLSTLISNEQSFLLAVTSSSLGCTCWSSFKNSVLTPYQIENHVQIYYINHQEFYDAEHKLLNTYGITITQDPAFAIFENGQTKYTEVYKTKNYIFSKPDYFKEYMSDKIKFPYMYYLSKDQLDEMYKGEEEFTVLFSRNNCGDCSYTQTNYLKQYGSEKMTQDSKPLYILECEDIQVKIGNTTVPLREYDEKGVLTEASKERWQNFKDEYGLSTTGNSDYGYSTGVVPTFLHIKPNAGNKNTTILDSLVYFNDTVEKIDGKFIITQSFFSNERQAKLHYLNGVTTPVLQGLELDPSQVTTSDSGYSIWNHDAAEKYHNPLLEAFLNYYLS